MQEKLLAVQRNVSGALDYLQDGLNRRQDVASVRALLEIMQDTAHVMAKVGHPQACPPPVLPSLSVPNLNACPHMRCRGWHMQAARSRTCASAKALKWIPLL
jgi:hypothetical protein